MSRPVQLRVYDLSNGLAKALSLSMLGKQIDGVWHTGVCVGCTEYFFGQGIQKCNKADSPFGQPLQEVCMGDTELPDEMIEEYLQDMHPHFNALTYNLLTNNCNNFSDELCQFLVGKHIPDYITGLPAEVSSTPFGQNLLKMLTPVLQERFSHATAAGFESDTATAEAAIQSAAESAQSQNPLSMPSMSTVSVSLPVGNVPASRVPQASALGREAGQKARKAFQSALADEFAKVTAEGVSDANKAGAEAVKRVMHAVRNGLVLPPVQPQGAAQRVTS